MKGAGSCETIVAFVGEHGEDGPSSSPLMRRMDAVIRLVAAT
jgi:hypothetical protein